MEKLSPKDYWNKVAAEKNFTLRPDFHLLETNIDKEAFIVDYGCGYGRTLDELFRKGYENTLGLDFSFNMIARGKRSYPRLKLKFITSSHTNLPDSSVDMVLLFAVLTCIVKDEEQQLVMEEIKRILKPGGVVYAMDFLLNIDGRNKNREDEEFFRVVIITASCRCVCTKYSD